MEEACVPEERNAFLRDCFVDGDAVEERRERRTKRRALAVSIILQALIVAVLILFPLFSKGENIANRAVYVPAVPYSPGRPHTTGKPTPRPPHSKPNACSFCAPPTIPPTISMHDARRDSANNQTNSDGDYIPGTLEGQPIPGAPTIVGARGETPPPPPPVKERIRVSESVIAARLIRRVQPVYPTLAIQIRREGRVELHAIIAKDGSIESLELVSGDPMFIQSALAAVRDWRYQPTLLNGQPVEVDTTIVVIYTLAH
jgi:periplasmic protein TonB